MKESMIVWLVPRLIFLVYKFFSLTINWKLVGDYEHWRNNSHLLAFWHARLLMIPYINKDWGGSMMISEHRDGSFIADAAHLLGIATSRGSSTRGGARAFLEMIRIARQGRSLGITPDGPKGPAEMVQMGTVQLAKKSGLPLRSVCYACKRHWRVNSWDRFYIPKPFTKGVIVLSDEVYADLEDDELNLKKFQAVMDETQHRADTYFD